MVLSLTSISYLHDFFYLFSYAFHFTIYQKKHNIKTFKEIVAFSEGNSNLEELQKKRNNKSYVKEKLFIVFTFTLVVGVLALIISFLTELFLKL